MKEVLKGVYNIIKWQTILISVVLFLWITGIHIQEYIQLSSVTHRFLQSYGIAIVLVATIEIAKQILRGE